MCVRVSKREQEREREMLDSYLMGVYFHNVSVVSEIGFSLGNIVVSSSLSPLLIEVI